VLFKGDLSRVIFASEQFAFRRRYELVDTSKSYSTITPTNLNFPFAQYWPAGGWDIDDRDRPANLTKFGFSTNRLDGNVRAIPVKSMFSITAFFNRDDDARIGHELMLYEKHPVRRLLYSEVVYEGKILSLPTNITVESIQFNPSFTENDWLKNNRIIPLIISIAVRSYIVGYPHQPNSLEPGMTGEIAQLTEKSILNFSTNKLNVPANDSLIITGLFDDLGQITVNKFGPIAIETTETTATIEWDVETSDSSYVTKILVKIPGREAIYIDPDNSLTGTYELTGLVAGSTYQSSAMIETSSGLLKVVNFTIATIGEVSEELVKKTKPGKLKGMSW
jgi:hypothetical protein